MRTPYFAALLIACCAVAYAQSNFPPEVQRQLLRQKILDAGKRSDWAVVVSAIEEYRQLAKNHPNDPTLEVPPALLADEAIAADKLGDDTRAAAALEEYFQKGSSQDALYKKAIELYPTAKKNAKVALLNNFLRTLDSQMVLVPGGRFQMGSDWCKKQDVGKNNRCSEDWHADPVHWVSVNPFRMQKRTTAYDVVTTFVDLLQLEGHSAYEVAQKFTLWANLKTGHSFRLPSESEYEYIIYGGAPPQFPFYNGFTVPRREDFFGVELNAGPELMNDCWHDNFESAPQDGSAWDIANCPNGQRVVRHAFIDGSFFERFAASEADGNTPVVTKGAYTLHNRVDCNCIYLRLVESVN